jgi:hypothetical protein
MKEKVNQFFTYIWDSKKPQIYYSSNFHYDGIISVIAESNYKGA